MRSFGCAFFIFGGNKIKIKVELLKGYIADTVASQVKDLEIDSNTVANTKAIMMLSEIQAILQNNTMSEEDCLIEIRKVFAENRLDTERYDY